MQREYNEDAELRRYVFGHFTHLFTELERLGTKAAYTEAKATNASQKMAEMLRSRWGHQNDPAVVAALSEGFEAFQTKVVARLQRDEMTRLYVNRCEECDRIVATPRACICGWCGHSWFERRAEQDSIADSFLTKQPAANKRMESNG